ncbi:sigma-E factor negative regulatory protein [Paraglaciecola psychrophila]|uniref:Anti-sigma-E factor RseA n=1 Tax=Paraglaciecola psychrophila 170 TaxID=1129794 RepID=K7A9P6_9ALTE|nr:RseA family anti-sigma factor [Paraglaciecola psychrophila]AGH45931.1 anti sigma-E protein, RseA [Paraglaciecola psychrophila 170]GAC37453.1 sigma-E factor negative regulatory protein RseA [Paraglaciecola psychrophila 170]
MSQKFENLSALVDGEHDISTSSSSLLLDAVKNDAELQLKWKSYHLIRDGLRQELPANINFDIADKIAQAIEAEPAILAPKKTWRDLPLVNNIIPFAKQGGQMAIAASVAVAMIIGVQQVNQSEVNQPFNAAPPIPGIQGGLSPVSFDQTRSIPNSDVVQQKRRINAYLTDHNQQIRFKTIQLSNDKSAIMSQDNNNEEAQSDIVENIPQ